MPAKFDSHYYFGTWSKENGPRGYKEFLRAFDFIHECARTHRLDLLVPGFREFFEFCEGRTFTPEAQHLVDVLRRMVADLNIEV